MKKTLTESIIELKASCIAFVGTLLAVMDQGHAIDRQLTYFERIMKPAFRLARQRAEARLKAELLEDPTGARKRKERRNGFNESDR